MYEVVFTRKAAKQVKNLEPAHRRKLKGIILALSQNPFSYPYKKIRGEDALTGSGLAVSGFSTRLMMRT
ncbi:hypothetical protein A3L09_00685 [Thermococcus profundus]|uniref:Plasmid stabilization protein n=1 Tax=Thermococcus profundus TaxID=49899 RepID=A0A2Z2M6V4_THEPR|nr:hypothetical protein [Thermococcus profundus]ASJ01877.1 hypothetical protein A3L09_00685 [Thermococcus profundus]